MKQDKKFISLLVTEKEARMIYTYRNSPSIRQYYYMMGALAISLIVALSLQTFLKINSYLSILVLIPSIIYMFKIVIKSVKSENYAKKIPLSELK